MSNWSLLAIPVIAAFIGWMTNYVAVKMLFHPREPKRILFFTLQGVFPKRQNVLAKKLGQLVATELFSAKDVIEKLKSSAHSSEVQESVSRLILQKLEQEIPLRIPMISMFLGGGALGEMLAQFRPMLGTLVDELIELFGSHLQGALKVEEVVEEKVARFSSDKLEEILLGIMKQEFRFIELIGGVLGFIIGCLQIFLVQIETWPN